MVDKLEKERLVERRLYAQDRRLVTLFLTEKGRELGTKVFNRSVEFNKNLTENLASTEPQFYEALGLLNEVLDQNKN